MDSNGCHLLLKRTGTRTLCGLAMGTVRKPLENQWIPTVAICSSRGRVQEPCVGLLWERCENHWKTNGFQRLPFAPQEDGYKNPVWACYGNGAKTIGKPMDSNGCHLLLKRTGTRTLCGLAMGTVRKPLENQWIPTVAICSSRGRVQEPCV